MCIEIPLPSCPCRKVVLDASAANKLAIPKTDDDMIDKVEATLELVKYLKTEVPSSGVVLDTSKVCYPNDTSWLHSCSCSLVLNKNIHRLYIYFGGIYTGVYGSAKWWS